MVKQKIIDLCVGVIVIGFVILGYIIGLYLFRIQGSIRYITSMYVAGAGLVLSFLIIEQINELAKKNKG